MSLYQEFIDVTTAIGCPVNCKKYCPQEVTIKRYKSTKLLTLDVFKAALKSIPTNVAVVFSGHSEPFTNHDLIDFIEFAQNQGYEIGIYTTLRGASTKDISRLIQLSFKSFVLHLPDGKNFKVANQDIDYMKNIFTVLQSVPNVTFCIMNELFESHNRENIVRGKLPPPRKIDFCQKHVTPQLAMLPNGDVHICCMDFGLEHCIGNLLVDNYSQIRAHYMSQTKNFRLCTYCSFNKPMEGVAKWNKGKDLKRN